MLDNNEIEEGQITIYQECLRISRDLLIKNKDEPPLDDQDDLQSDAPMADYEFSDYQNNFEDD